MLRYVPSMPSFWSYSHKWVLNFVKGFFCIYWDYHTVSIFQFVNMVYHIDWLAYTEESLHPWHKPNLIMIKKAECWRINAIELWCWRRLLRVPWTSKRSNQSILKEISPQYSLEGLMLKPKLQYFGHLMWRTDSFEKTLMLGKIEGRRRRGWQRMRLFEWHHWLDGHEFEQAPGLGDGQGGLACSIYGIAESQTWLSDWNGPIMVYELFNVLLNSVC